MTTLYMAYSPVVDSTLRAHAQDAPVNLLVAYPMLKSFTSARHDFNIRRWVMDSGAFSVYNAGKSIDLGAYIEACLQTDASEVFGLDVIGDADATKRNLEAMWEAGVAAIPTYHIGEPEEHLRWCADRAPKIALGGIARMKGTARVEWARQCLARIWPKRVHLFGVTTMAALQAGPWDSADGTWHWMAHRWGQWVSHGQQRLSVRGEVDLWSEIEEHMRREQWARWRWKDELAVLAERSEVAP